MAVRRKSKLKIRTIILIQLVVAVLVLAGLELVCRVFYQPLLVFPMLLDPDTKESISTEDPEDPNNPLLSQTLSQLRSDQCQCREDPVCRLRWGYRDRDLACAKPAGTSRVLFLGASSIYGVMLDPNETIPAVFEQKAGERGLTVQAVNAAISGKTLLDCYHTLRNLAPKLDADIVVLYSGQNEQHSLRQTGNILAREIAHPGTKYYLPLYNRFALLKVGALMAQKGRSAVQENLDMIHKYPARRIVEDFAAESRAARVLDEDQYRSLLEIKRLVYQRAQRRLAAIVDYCRESNLRLLVALPVSDLLQPPISSTHGPRYRTNQERFDELAIKAQQALAGNEVERALTMFTELAELDPLFALTHHMIGQCLLRLGRPLKARKHLEQSFDQLVLYNGSPELEGASPELVSLLEQTALSHGAQIWDTGLALRGGLDPSDDFVIFFDYLHLNFRGASTFAGKLLDHLVELKWLGESALPDQD